MAWYNYSVHNPFRTPEQQKKDRENAKYYSACDKRWSDYHPDDSLLVAFRAMIHPAPTLSIPARVAYHCQRLMRKYTDVSNAALKGRSKEDIDKFYKLLENDMKNVKHWDNIKAKNENECKEWRIKQQARELSERAFIYKPRTRLQ